MVNKAPVWAEINLNAIAQNVRQLKGITNPGAELMAVVKANAYGHGAEQVARIALQNGASRLAVARVREGAALRLAGIRAPMLILGYTPSQDYDSLLMYDLAQTVYSLKMAQDLSCLAARACKKITVHIKVDTGMGRLGFIAQKDSVKDITALAALSHLNVDGIFTHFASADSLNKDYAFRQMQKFTELLDGLTREGLRFKYRHAANSAALIDLPESHFDLVRPGIALYGVYPSAEVKQNRVALKPAMSVKAKIAQVKRVPAGTGVSYGVTYITPQDTVVATIPVGYADGYSRLLSSRGEVLIHGQRARIIGRICMDQFMVDVGHIPGVNIEDEVVLMGHQGGETITAEEIAGQIGTIGYEVLCMVSARVPRCYISE